MRNFKLFAVLTVFFFFMNLQLTFAQTTYNFDCRSFTLPLSQCMFISSDMALLGGGGINVWHGRPRVSTTCNGNKSLFLNYWYNGSSDYTYGSDGASLRYTFAAGRRYQIKYKIAVKRDMQFVLDFISTPSIPSPTFGNIANPLESTATASASGYLLPTVPSNSVNMQRLESNGPNGPSSPCYTEGQDSCEFIEKVFEYNATVDGEFIYLRLDRSGNGNDAGHVQIRLDDISVAEIPNPDFSLRIIGTTFAKANIRSTITPFITVNRFNFSVSPFEQDGSNYRLEVFRSASELDNTNYPTNIIDGFGVAQTNPVFTQTNTAPLDINTFEQKRDTGFLQFETSSPNCFYYRVRLTVTKDGIERNMSRIVKACYLTNMLPNNGFYNPAFNFIISDNSGGINRTRTFSALNRSTIALAPNEVPSNHTPWWLGGAYSSNQFGFFNEGPIPWESAPHNPSPAAENYTTQFLHPVTQAGEFVRVRTALLGNGLVSTNDGLLVYDKIEIQEPLTPCSPIGSLSELPKQLSQRKLVKETIKNDLNIFPNPTSEQAIIKYNISQSGNVNIYVTDITGKRISELVQNEERQAGSHEVLFARKSITSGMYFVVMENGQDKVVKKLILN